jgi:23S rRNA pseudouridine1911/1915/1917 synthase
LQKLLKEEAVLVNEKPVKSNYKVGTLDMIQLSIPEAVELEIEAEDMPLDIIYEDKDIILINKPKGMVVHPAAGHYSGTLVNGLMAHCKEDLSGINGVMRPGIVHRIDMDTTGALIVCKNDVAHNSIAEQLKEHSITRKYFAVVHGVLKQDEGTVSAPIGRHPVDRKKMSINEKNGREAVTHYRVLERYRQFTYVECQLETGRTHQIRVHLASIGHPLLGDSVYGPAKSPYRLNGQTLHAGILGIIHPRTGEYMEFTAPLPDYFEDLLRKLRTT